MTRLKDSLGVAIVGSGFMGTTYAETISRYVEGASLVGIYGGPKAPALAEQYRVRCFDRFEEICSHPEVALVVIATPHASHAEYAAGAAGSGKHLLIEKPMACTVEECDRILEICHAGNLKCGIMYTHRARVANAKAKELIDTGRLGRVTHIRSYQIVPQGMSVVPAWQLDASSLGLLFGHGVHNLDALRWFTGQEIKTVYAQCRNMTAPYAVEGTSDVLATMADGSTGYVFCSFETPRPGFPRSEIGSRIICERGLVDIDVYGETRASIEGGAWQVIAIQEPIDWAGKGALDIVRLRAYIANIHDMIAAIREDRQPNNSGWDGRQAVAAALAAYESNRTGQPITLY